MTTTPSTTDGVLDADPVTAVLVSARRHQAAAQAAEAALLVTAVEWAVLHPAESRASAATYGCGRNETDQHLAGAGAPLVDQWCPAELAGALHLSTEAGQRLIGEALELKYRLPRLWWLVQAGKLAAWQARRVAAHTLALSADAAAFIDRNTVIRAGRIGPVLLDRLIAEAIARYTPDEAAQLHARQAERRCFDIGHHPGDDGLAGQSLVYGILDLPDGLDLDAAITDGARLLKNLGDTASLDVRRARAAGDLARRQPCLDLNDLIEDTTPEPPPDDHDDVHGCGGPDHDSQPIRRSVGTAGRPVPETLSRQVIPRQVVLYLHLSDHAITGGPDAAAATVGRVQNTQLPVLAEQIRDWIGQPDTHITVKPVIDLLDSVAVDAYEIPDRIRERVLLRHPTCVFPWCHKPSFRTDLDHRIRYDAAGPPGQTSTDNLAPLCRRHHRLKTFTRWRYHVGDQPGSYVWTSPHDLRFLRDHTGTTTEAPHAGDHGYRTIGDIMRSLNPFTGEFYREALQVSRMTREMFCLMEGRHVHPSTLYPGGVGTVATIQLMTDYITRLMRYVEFMKKVVPMHDDLFDFFYTALPGYEQVGLRRTLLACWGSFQDPEHCNFEYADMTNWGRKMYVTPGVVVDGKLVTTDLVEINLGIRILLGSSYYDDWEDKEMFVTKDPLGNPVDRRHPWNQHTNPKPQKRDLDNKYSWVMSPRWFDGKDYLALDTGGGPLARLWVTALAGLVDIGYVKSTGSSVKINLPKTALRGPVEFEWKIPQWSNTIERNRARTYFQAYAAACALHFAEKALVEIRAGRTKTWEKFTVPDTGLGCGFTEAVRGVLSHHLVIRDGKIANYHPYPPTPWNASPRDSYGTPGPYEDAVQGQPIFEENDREHFKGIDIMRTVRSFDPCLPCGVHMYLGEGQKLERLHSPTEYIAE